MISGIICMPWKLVLGILVSSNLTPIVGINKEHTTGSVTTECKRFFFFTKHILVWHSVTVMDHLVKKKAYI